VNTNLQLILGGARSGKSRFSLAQDGDSSFDRRVFLATATAADQEMKERIRKHQADRGPQWETLEAPYHLIEVLEKLKNEPKTLVVVDCATLWLSNLLCGMGGPALSLSEIEEQIARLTDTLSKIGSPTRSVSNEVGLSIVPDSVLGRQFRDLQGLLNQKLASQAGQVFFLVAGIPQKIK
jgi:adenosylcobinamide kinase/adenosylcobinamide-phosphate guanylyltransferase